MPELTVEQLRRELARLEAENKRLEAENRHLRETIHRAKDISPVQRPSFKRVSQLVSSACMNLHRLRSGWQLQMGHLQRRFKSLGQIWETLTRDDWHLGEVFPPSEQERPRLPKRHPAIAPPLTKNWSNQLWMKMPTASPKDNLYLGE